MKRPSFQFYPADWRKDTALQFCSLAAQGLWINAMCIAHECEPYGHLTVNGKPMNSAQIGRMVGISAKECDKLLSELIDAGVCSKADGGSVYSRRMVRDEDLRNRRATGGAAGGEHGAKGAAFGVQGGRPRKDSRGTENPPSDETRGVSEPPSKPPPSSSSSSSSSEVPPVSPQGGKRSSAVGLMAWIESVKAAGDAPVGEDDPVFTYAAEVGIPTEFLRLAWMEFKNRYSHPDAKRYRDWRRVFCNAVRGNWLKLWFYDPACSQYGLTTVGMQAQRAHAERKSA